MPEEKDKVEESFQNNNKAQIARNVAGETVSASVNSALSEVSEEAAIPEIRWQGKEFKKYENNIKWYWAVSLGAIVLIIINILLKNYSFIAVVLAGTYLLIYFSKKEPSMVEFGIGPTGVSVGKKTYPFDEFLSFSLHYNPAEANYAVLKRKKHFALDIELPLPDNSNIVADIGRVLSMVLKQEDKDEPFTNVFSRIIKF